MILSVHAITGTAVALALRGNPVTALIASFFSHFALDAVPHWHYRILSIEKDESSPFGEKMSFGVKFFKDVFWTGIDFGAGFIISIVVSVYFFPGNFWLAAFSSFAGALPDLLQVAYYRFKNFKPLYWLQWFHERAHSERRLDNEPIKGIFQQAAFAVIVVLALIYLR